MERPGEGEEPSEKSARSAQHQEGADEVIIEGITFRASARPHNWGLGRGGAGGARSKPKETAFPPAVKLRMTNISRDRVPAIAKKAAARNYPSWACAECTYQHEQVNGEASLRKCTMCGTPRPIRRPRPRETGVKPAVSSAAAQPRPLLSNTASTVPRVGAPPPPHFLTNPPPKRFTSCMVDKVHPAVPHEPPHSPPPHPSPPFGSGIGLASSPPARNLNPFAPGGCRCFRTHRYALGLGSPAWSQRRGVWPSRELDQRAPQCTHFPIPTPTPAGERAPAASRRVRRRRWATATGRAAVPREATATIRPIRPHTRSGRRRGTSGRWRCTRSSTLTSMRIDDPSGCVSAPLPPSIKQLTILCSHLLHTSHPLHTFPRTPPPAPLECPTPVQACVVCNEGGTDDRGSVGIPNILELYPPPFLSSLITTTLKLATLAPSTSIPSPNPYQVGCSVCNTWVHLTCTPWRSMAEAAADEEYSCPHCAGDSSNASAAAAAAAAAAAFMAPGSHDRVPLHKGSTKALEKSRKAAVGRLWRLNDSPPETSPPAVARAVYTSPWSGPQLEARRRDAEKHVGGRGGAVEQSSATGAEEAYSIDLISTSADLNSTSSDLSPSPRAAGVLGLSCCVKPTSSRRVCAPNDAVTLLPCAAGCPKRERSSSDCGTALAGGARRGEGGFVEVLLAARKAAEREAAAASPPERSDITARDCGISAPPKGATAPPPTRSQPREVISLDENEPDEIEFAVGGAVGVAVGNAVGGAPLLKKGLKLARGDTSAARDPAAKTSPPVAEGPIVLRPVPLPYVATGTVTPPPQPFPIPPPPRSQPPPHTRRILSEAEYAARRAEAQQAAQAAQRRAEAQQAAQAAEVVRHLITGHEHRAAAVPPPTGSPYPSPLQHAAAHAAHAAAHQPPARCPAVAFAFPLCVYAKPQYALPISHHGQVGSAHAQPPPPQHRQQGQQAQQAQQSQQAQQGQQSQQSQQQQGQQAQQGQQTQQGQQAQQGERGTKRAMEEDAEVDRPTLTNAEANGGKHASCGDMRTASEEVRTLTRTRTRSRSRSRSRPQLLT